MKYELLDDLLHRLMNADTFVSGKNLALALNTSEKTVLKYMNILKEQLAGKGAEIEVRQGYGSRLVITDEKRFQEYLKTFDQQENGILNNPETRRSYVLMRLLTADDFISLYDLADELYISPSLLRSIIHSLKGTAAQYDLVILNSHRSGYRIAGNEAKIRRCLSQECRDIENVSRSVHTGQNDAFGTILHIIEDELRCFGIALSTGSVNALALHIMIAINRIETNHVIELEKTFDLLKLKGSPEYFLANRINTRLKTQLNISLPEPELLYLTMHINGKQRIQQHELLHTNVAVDDIVFYNMFLRNIYRMADVDFFEDRELRESLMNHIVPFRNRVRNDMQINKADLESIRSQFPYAYELALYGLSMYPEGKITPSETAYFSIHLELALEKHANPGKKYNITVLCSDVTTIYQIITFKLTQRFGNRIDMIKFGTMEQVQKEYDAYIGSSDLLINLTDQSVSYPVKTISASEFFTENEMQEIDGALHFLEAEDRMNSLMHNTFYMHSQARSRDEILTEMTEYLRRKITLPSDFLDRVREREKMGATEYSGQIAIPHPVKNDDIPDFLAIACLDKPAVWEKKEVSLVFLFSASSFTSSWFMEQAAKLMQSPQTVNLLKESEDLKGFLHVFLSL